MFALSNFTMNLSSYTLSEAQISVLDKGLTFIPSTHYVPYARILECKNRSIRSIKMRDYFYKKTSVSTILMHSKIFLNPRVLGVSE